MRYLLLLLFLISLPSSGQEIHSKHCLYGCPNGVPDTNDLVIRDIYIMSSNDATKFADWVAYRITPDMIGSSKERKWKADPVLAEDETLEPNDYRGANAALKTDRGHQAPLASFTGTDDWEQTNYLSNITPQKSALNQSSWAHLESAIRNLVKNTDAAVYVMTGPLYERNMLPLPHADESHRIPSGYWKVISIVRSHFIKTSAFIFEQDTPRNADYCEMLVDLNDVNNRSNLTFFHGLPDNHTLENSPASLVDGLGCTLN